MLFSWLAVPAESDIQSDMDAMFQKMGFRSNTTGPSAYMAQTRGFISGGSVEARANVQPFDIFSVSPPHIKAGCGGLDLYFGGLNFINKQQIITLLKSVGQNALGYAFSMGLEAVCPTCNSESEKMDR